MASASAFSMAVHPMWPPSSLANMNVHNLVNHCEEAEMNPATTCLQQPYLALTHICALLYLGEYVHVRHLMRRHPFSTSSDSGQNNLDKLLQEWWHTVACPILEKDPTRAMQGLEHCRLHNPAPFSRYAAEIAIVYRYRQQRYNKDDEEEKDSARRTVSIMDASTATAPVVAFLESSQWSA